MKNTQIIFITILGLFLGGCSSTKPTSNAEEEKKEDVVKEEEEEKKCSIWVLAKDFSGLDGCSILFIRENGKKLLPVKGLPEDLVLENDQQYMISYKLLEEVASICMAEDAAVKITCIRKAEGKEIRPCVDTKDPMSIEWMKRQEKIIDPQRIMRHDSGNNVYIYQYEKDKNKYFFDCTGALICYTPKGEDVCFNIRDKLWGTTSVIWVVNY